MALDFSAFDNIEEEEAIDFSAFDSATEDSTEDAIVPAEGISLDNVTPSSGGEVKPLVGSNMTLTEAMSDSTVKIGDFAKILNKDNVVSSAVIGDLGAIQEQTPDQASDIQAEEAMPTIKDKSLAEVGTDAVETVADVGTGVGSAMSKLGALGTNWVADVLGSAGATDTASAIKEWNKGNKDLWESKVKEAGVAGQIGEFVAEAVGPAKLGNAVNYAKVALSETLKSMARNDVFAEEGDSFSLEKFARVSSEVGTGMAFMAGINRLFPHTDFEVKTSAGVNFEAMPKSKQNELIGMFDQADRLGIEKMDDVGQRKVLNAILKDKNVDINKVVNEGLKESFEKSKTTYNTAYDVANKAGKESGTVGKSSINSSVNKALNETSTSGTLNTSETKMSDKIRKIVSGYGKGKADDVVDGTITVKPVRLGGKTSGLKSGKQLTMADLESIRKDISGLASTKKGKSQGHLINAAISSIDEQIEALAKSSGIDPKLYSSARGLYKDHIKSFGGKVEGSGQIAGRAVGKVLSEEDGDAMRIMLNDGIKKTELSKRMVKEFPEEQRKAMVLKIALDGADIGTSAGSTKALAKLDGMKDDALYAMIGKKSAVELKNNIKLLNAINRSDDEIFATTIGQDLRMIAFAPFVGVVHPLKKGSMLIAGSGNLIHKVSGSLSNKEVLLKRIKTIKNKKARFEAMTLVNKAFTNRADNLVTTEDDVDDEEDDFVWGKYDDN